MGALDLLTLAEAKRAINVPASWAVHEDELALFVAGVSGRIDDMCGPVVVREVVEWHDGGESSIWLRQPPVASVTSVTEYDSTTATVLDPEDEATVPADGYLAELDGHFAVVRRRSGGSDLRFGSGRRRVKVAYSAGRFATTSAVDAKFKLAAGAILRRMWQREAGSWARGGDPFAGDESVVGFFRAVDPMVAELLADELRGPVMA